MIAADAPLRAGELRRSLANARFGREIEVRATTASTNDDIHLRALEGATSALVLIAETQTAGRGQHGRRWESSPRLGLWLSILLRPEIPVAQSPLLTHWAAETVSRFLQEQFAIAAEVKPPNDILVRGKKIAGLLVEMRAQENAPHLAILGLGLNVNQTRENFSPALQSTATAVALELGHFVDRTKLAIALLRALGATYRW